MSHISFLKFWESLNSDSYFFNAKLKLSLFLIVHVFTDDDNDDKQLARAV